MVAHISLVVILALIVVKSQTQQSGLSFLSKQAEERSEFTLLPVPPIALLPEPVAPATPATVEPTVLSRIELPIPQPLAPSVAQPPSAVGERKQPPSPELGALDAVAVSIQNRVSQAGGRKGEVQFALSWTNVNDVDIHVITPPGDRISHRRRRSRDNGLLDVDMNVDGESRHPVENVRWIRNAPAGRYTILVHLFRIHDRDRSNRNRNTRFQLLAQLGSETVVREDVISPRNQLSVFRFTYIPDLVPSNRRAALVTSLSELQEAEEIEARRMFDLAAATPAQRLRDLELNLIIVRYPHTDVAIEAMQLLGGNVTK